MLLLSTSCFNLFIDVICESVLYVFMLKEFASPQSECLGKLIVSKTKLTSDIFIGKCLSRLIQFYHYHLNKLTATKAGFGKSFVLESCVNLDDR